MSKKVLYLSYDGLTDPLGQSQVLPYITGIAAQSAFTFTIISFEKKEAFDRERKVIEGIIQPYPIEWIPLRYHKNPPVLSTILDVFRLWSMVKKIVSKEEISLIHCRSYITSLVGLPMKRKFKIPFLFDMRGFWADERIEGGIWSLNNPIHYRIYRYFKRKEKEFLQESDHVISLTHKAKEIIESWPLKQKAPVTVIPCCVDMELFDPDRINKNEIHQLRNSLGLNEDDFALGYVGSLGTWYMVDEMTDFFIALFKKNPKTKFLVLTRDDVEPIRSKLIENRIPEERLISKFVQRAEMPLYVALFDWSIFFIKPTFSKQASSPTKMGEIMAMGKPIIANRGIGDNDAMISNVGIVLDLDEQEKIMVDLTEFKVDQTIREACSGHFSLAKGASEYLYVYKSLQNSN